jgi:hypothetical protein
MYVNIKENGTPQGKRYNHRPNLDEAIRVLGPEEPYRDPEEVGA